GGDPRARRPAVTKQSRAGRGALVPVFMAELWTPPVDHRSCTRTDRSRKGLWVTLADTHEKTEDAGRDAAVVIYVCTTCRRPDDPEDYPRPGAALAEATLRATENSGI